MLWCLNKILFNKIKIDLNLNYSFSERMIEIVQLILAILGLNSISRVTREAVNNVSQQIENALQKIKLESRILLDANPNFTVSSGEFFDQNLVRLMSNINGVNKNLDFNTTIMGILENTDS